MALAVYIKVTEVAAFLQFSPPKKWHAIPSAEFLSRVVTRVSVSTNIKVHTYESIYETLCGSKSSYVVESGGGGGGGIKRTIKIHLKPKMHILIEINPDDHLWSRCFLGKGTW
jgi:hypothetical protein